MQFLLDYPLGKKLQRHLEFYVAQLNYEYETGRESALEMLAMIFSAFPLVGGATGAVVRMLASRLSESESELRCFEVGTILFIPVLGSDVLIVFMQ